jgi:hypothetical protein
LKSNIEYQQEAVTFQFSTVSHGGPYVCTAFNVVGQKR